VSAQESKEPLEAMSDNGIFALMMTDRDSVAKFYLYDKNALWQLVYSDGLQA
jgi:hypothetical protein